MIRGDDMLYEKMAIILGFSIASLILAFLTLRVLGFWVSKFIGSNKGKKTVKRISLKVYLLFLLIGIYASLNYVYISNTFVRVLYDYLPLFIFIIIGYLIIRIFDGLLYEVLYSFAKKTETKLDDMLLPIIRNAIYITVGLVIIIIVLAKMGYDVSAFVTSLGVGGIAIAMASQQILQNFFGGIVILADGTFRIGDRIVVKGHEGIVKEISLRTTRIEKDDGSIVSIPNSVLLKEAVILKKGP